MYNFENLFLTKEAFGDKLDYYLAQTVKILTKAGYECAIKEVGDADTGSIYDIRYNFVEDMEFGNPTIHWLDEDDEDALAIGYDVIDSMYDYYDEEEY